MKEPFESNANRDARTDLPDAGSTVSSGPDKPLESSTPRPQVAPKTVDVDKLTRDTLVEAAVKPKPPLAWLGIVSGPGAIRGHTFVLRQDNIIGRSKGDILLAGDATISSRHAQITLETSQGGAQRRVFVLYDLNSTNGTHVGTLETVSNQANRIQRYELHDGDYILLGKTLLVFLQT